MNISSLLPTFQTENLSELSPALLSNVGVVCMSRSDVGWRMMLQMWLDKHQEGEQEVIQAFCDQYIEKVIGHLDEYTKPSMLAGLTQEGHYKRVIPHSNEAMISTFTTLFEVRHKKFQTDGHFNMLHWTEMADGHLRPVSNG